MRKLLLVALAAGCAPPAPTAAPPPPASIVIPVSPPATVLPPTGARCPDLSSRAKAAAKAIFQTEREKAPPPPAEGYDDQLFAVPPIVGACFEDGAGAFVVTLERARLQEGW